jgi:ABC-type Na+ efflux pump permease subunit
VENKMVKLLIKTKGMFINIPGLIPFRTPAEVDITKVNINLVISELKKNGIEKYKIISDDSISLEKTIDRMIVKRNSFRNNITEIKKIDDSSEILKNQQKSILKIEGLLEKFLNSDVLTSKTSYERKRAEEEISFTKPKKKFDDSVDDFIPSINLENINLKGTSSTRKITNKTDLSNVEKLKNVSKNKKGDL